MPAANHPLARLRMCTALIKGTRRELRQSHRAKQREAASENPLSMPAKSVTELGNLEDFFAEAELAGREFEVERDTTVFFTDSSGKLVQAPSLDAQDPGASPGELALDELPMPRRPHWVAGQTSAEELDRMEKDAFLAWRRQVADSEAKAERLGYLPTPFEKNIQFWRQLWRVVERSDVLVQVVDARNPALFRFPDLEQYVREVGALKQNLLLINKADMLAPEERRAYSEYFARERVAFVFFSAKQSQAFIDAGLDEEKHDEQVLTREELLGKLSQVAREAAAAQGRDDLGIVGMAGYPNVGKSSVINSLLGAAVTDHAAQRVSVSATPGHTKHFQTISVGNMTLCDCPGLVFPSFVATKAEMLVSGILPIDEMRGRDFIPALELVVQRIPKLMFEHEYKIKLDLPGELRRATVPALLDAFCVARGLFGTGHGRIDESKGSRLILKDFVQGKLLYVTPPPGAPSNLLVFEHGTEQEQLAKDADAQMLYEAEKREAHELAHLQGPSRRLARHGRKHKKGRDKNPYEHDASAFGAVVKDNKSAAAQDAKFVRKQQAGEGLA
jgi:large subunit GTPase 1